MFLSQLLCDELVINQIILPVGADVKICPEGHVFMSLRHKNMKTQTFEEENKYLMHVLKK